MRIYKRGLSNKQAAACENAKHPRCKCRCSGRLHGAGHAQLQANERSVLAEGTRTITEDQITKIIDNLETMAAGELPASRRQFPDPTARTKRPAPATLGGQLPLIMEEVRNQ